MNKLDGKVAVITGGSSGIGLATALEFKALGAKIVIAGRDETTLQAAARQLGSDVLAVRADVSVMDDLDELFASTTARFGGIDIVFVNAGMAKMGPIEAMSEAVFDAVMATNFKGAYYTIQKALPHLNENASIILNGSLNAHVGFANASLYSASKAALHSLARTLTAELVGRGIRINTLNTGPINTPIYSKLGLPEEVVQGFAQTMAGRVPLKRFGTPEEVAKAAAFLASSDSAFILGSEITADGGMSINML